MPEKKEQDRRPRVADCSLLIVVLLISALPYLAGLGFYCDDWTYQAEIARHSNQGAYTTFRELIAEDADLRVRPVQAAYLVMSVKAFGPHPLRYSLLDTAMLGIGVLLLYLVLMEAGIGRLSSLSIALVFSVLPHYSTDRVWISSQQAVLCIVFALLGIYGLLRSIRSEKFHSIAWLAGGTAALILSILSYEVALGIICASVAAIGWLRYRKTLRAGRHGAIGLVGLACVGVSLLALLAVKAHMQTKLAYHHHFFERLGALTRHAAMQGIQFNTWTYFLRMPAVLGSLYRHSAISGAADIAGAIIACSVAAYLWRFMTPSGILTRTAALWLIVLGFVVFYLGFGLFFPNIGWDFSTAGSGNRVAIASAIGAACVLVGIVGLICSAIPGGLKQVRVFSIAMGLACGANCLVVSGIGSYWVDAGAQVKGIVNSLKEDVPALPQGSTLLLDGFCRNRGPALLLVSDWDATGAVRIALADYTLTGDVVSDDATFGATAVDTMMDGHPEGHYPYSDHLFVYNARYRVLKPLPSQGAASAYLRAMNPTGDNGCTAAHDREVAGIL